MADASGAKDKLGLGELRIKIEWQRTRIVQVCQRVPVVCKRIDDEFVDGLSYWGFAAVY